MKTGEILSNSLLYPLHNIRSLVLFMLLGIIGGLAGGTTIVGIIVGSMDQNTFEITVSAVLGLIVLAIICLVILGYTLDIIKYGVDKREDGPNINIKRQIPNAIKLLIVDIVYYIIPVIITFILGFIFKNWIANCIGFVLMALFALANFMAKCRLSKSSSLGQALAVGQAIGDISRIGISKVVTAVILIFVVMIVIGIIILLLLSFNSIIGSVAFGILGVYAIFVYNRAIGLLYSNI